MKPRRPPDRLAWARLAAAAAVLVGAGASLLAAAEPEAFIDLPADVVADKIQGGLLGQLLGNLNGLPHEMKYFAEPGKVESYTPGLPDGARTDDDTDIEWTYVVAMEKDGRVLLPPARVRELWTAHLNGGIWCANAYARALMDLGLDPPLTGRSALNPWSHFNISGQFVSECFGLVAPAMPQTAARIGVHYTRTAIDGEPAQATQMFAAMIATAFVADDIEKIVAAGVASVDPASETCAVARDVLRLRKEHPKDWRELRRLVHEKYATHGGMRDSNGCELNTAAVLAALLYGGGDFVESLRLAFNLGYDADCNAATVGTVVGVVRGRRWMDTQGWKIRDIYKNTSRPGMPTDETITGFGGRLINVAGQVIVAVGGHATADADGRIIFRIPRQPPACVEPLARPQDRLAELRKTLGPQIEKDLSGSDQDRARAAYLALCLGQADDVRTRRPQDWARALEALRGYPKLLKAMADGGPDPAVSERFKAYAAAAAPQEKPPAR